MSQRRWRWMACTAIVLIAVTRWAWSQQAMPPGAYPPGAYPPGAYPPGANPPAGEVSPLKTVPLPVPVAKGNPIVGADKDLPDYSWRLPDYTHMPGSAAQREPRVTVGRLPIFGYSFFEPARQVITARAAFLRRLLAQDVMKTRPALPTARGVAQGGEKPTEADMALILAMTDAQKADLRDRQRTGKLTDEEKQKYRWFLRSAEAPGAAPADQQPTGKGEDIRRTTETVSGLTESRKAEILQLYHDNKLTPEEMRQYASLIAEEQPTAQTPPDAPGAAVDSADTTPSQMQGTKPSLMPLPDVDAFRQIADPLATVLQRITPTAPMDYQVAGGDVLVLRYWSPTLESHEERLVVDSSGSVDVPSVGRIVVRGQTTAQAEVALRERMRGFYRNVEVSVQLKELRTMPVVVNGESFFPGTYQVPAVATAFNVLYATGGPTDDGTLRRIEVRRRGAVVATIDLYKFLLTGDQLEDTRLQPGDVLFIPPRSARVGVRGEVRRPAKYELADKESLGDALRYAGGINASGVAQRVQLTTVQPGATRVLKEVDWTQKNAGQGVALYDGDTVEVFSVRTLLVNKVSIEGAVDQPGEYAIADHMTVGDLIERARGLVSEAYTTRADLYRVNGDNTLSLVPIDLEKALGRDPAANVVLSRWDRLHVYTRDEVAWSGRREITVRGAVRNPGIYTRNENSRVKDILQQAGGALPEAAEVVVLHQNPDRSYAYEYADVAAVVKEDQKQNVLVRDQDILAVYRRDETRFTPDHVFEIRGEVTAPGTYPRGRGMRLSDALRLAGGLTPKAGTTVLVASARIDRAETPQSATVSAAGLAPVPDPELHDGDVIAVQGRGTYQDKPWVVMVSGLVNKPGPVVVTNGAMRLSEAIALAGGLRPEAYAPGASFDRQPDLLATAGQRQVATVIAKLNDLLNSNEYTRALGRAEVERVRAIGSAAKGGSVPAIPGLTATAETDSAAAAATASALPKGRELVSPPRILSTAELLPKGNVAIDLPAALKSPKGDDDILMADGDVVVVPERPTTVRVGGAVVDSRAVVYQPGANLEYYVSRAGGYAIDAARDRIAVIRLGGGLMPAKSVKSLEPGDLILVPTKVLAERFQSHTSEIDAFFRGLTSSAIVYKLAESLFKF